MKQLLLILTTAFLFTGCALSQKNLNNENYENLTELDKRDKQVFKDNKPKSWNSFFDSDEWIPVNKDSEIIKEKETING